MDKANSIQISIQRAEEQIRQERDTFEQRKKQDHIWFYLRLAMGISAVIFLPAIMIVCSFVILSPKIYSASTVSLCSAALLTDILGLFISVWKIVLTPNSMTELKPVTEADPSIFLSEETTQTQAAIVVVSADA